MKDIWRHLFVKCFKLVIIIYFFSITNIYAQVTSSDIANQAVENILKTQENTNEVITLDSVAPLESSDVESGELYRVKIISKKSFEELKNYKNKRINEIMFVTDIINDQMEGLIFEVFVTTPPKKKPDEPYPFKALGFNYKNDKKDLQGDLKILTVNNPFDFNKYLNPKTVIFVSFLLAACLLILISYIGYKIYIKLKQRKERRLLVESYIGLLENANSREDFEGVYASRKKIKEFVDLDNKGFILLLNKINDYQYRKEWKPDYTDELLALKEKIIIDGENRGI